MVNWGSSGTCTTSFTFANPTPRPLMPGTQEPPRACCALKLLPEESIKKFDRGEQSSKRQKPLGPDPCGPPSEELPPNPLSANEPPDPIVPPPPEPPAPPPSIGGDPESTMMPPSAFAAGAVAAGISMVRDPSTIVALVSSSVYSSHVSALNFSSGVVGAEPQPSLMAKRRATAVKERKAFLEV